MKSATAYKVLKNEDLVLFESARDYAMTIRDESETIKSVAIKEAELIKNQARAQSIAEVHAQQQDLMQSLDNKLASTFSQLRDDVYLVIYKILQEFGLVLQSTDQVKQIILRELDKFDVKAEDTIVYANSYTQQKLLDAFSNFTGNIRLNEALIDDECILESKLYIFRLNLPVAVNKLEQIFKVKG